MKHVVKLMSPTGPKYIEFDGPNAPEWFKYVHYEDGVEVVDGKYRLVGLVDGEWVYEHEE